MSYAKSPTLHQIGTHLQNNQNVSRIYTSLEPNGDESWDVVTVIETNLVLDPERPEHSPNACDRLVQDIEFDMRAGHLAGRVKVCGVS